MSRTEAAASARNDWLLLNAFTESRWPRYRRYTAPDSTMCARIVLSALDEYKYLLIICTG